MMSALKKLKTFEALNEFDLTLTQPNTLDQPPQTPADQPLDPSVSTTLATKPNTHKSHVPLVVPARQCRLPVPSFIVLESEASAIPSKERIDSVMRKRQSMLDSHRNQGSRLPWLKWTLPVLHVETPKVKVQSEPVPFKTMSRSYTMPAGISQIGKPGIDRNRTRRADAVKSVEIDRTRKNIPSRSTSGGQRPTIKSRPASAGRLSEDKPSAAKAPPRPRVLLSNGPGRKPRPLPPKASVFRQKRLPSESRTARLTMGISARPPKDSDETNRLVPPMPSMPSRIGRLLTVKSDEKEGKRRPVSFAGTSAQRPDSVQRSDGSILEPNKKYGHLVQPVATRTTPLPKQDVRVRRQSAPLVERPEKLSGSQRKNKPQDESKAQRNGEAKPPSKNAALKGVKTVRVH
ncbi:hypothetical protein CLU79DRAFT_769500 [Phycomyces nitens]|nr:hypothetical protein CLU79DRAFT_769500 [Phycomyces nitens]